MHEADMRTDRPGSFPRSTGSPGHVVVIGGGIAGLAAAHRLLGEGVRVTIGEREANDLFLQVARAWRQ